jgi:hypothetical protein
MITLKTLGTSDALYIKRNDHLTKGEFMCKARFLIKYLGLHGIRHQVREMFMLDVLKVAGE